MLCGLALEVEPARFAFLQIALMTLDLKPDQPGDLNAAGENAGDVHLGDGSTALGHALFKGTTGACVISLANKLTTTRPRKTVDKVAADRANFNPRRISSLV